MNMKVATWNLDQLFRFNGARAARQRTHTDAIGADVWVFTETHPRFTLGSGYECIASSPVAHDIPSEGGRWVSIWSRLSAEVVNLTSDLERVAAIRLKDSGVVIVGTVLPWNSDMRDPKVSGSVAFQARLSEQAAEWSRLRDTCGNRLCVVGDLNQDLLPSKHFYGSRDGKRALLDALRDCELTCLTSGANDPLKDVPGRASIDHICIGEGLQVKNPSAVWPEPGTLTKNLSDHYGVWAELEIAPS